MRSTASQPPLRILIAEAHPIVVLGLTDLLHKLGYVLIGSVASGQEALLAAGEHRPDLLLMDVELRGDMDGITAAIEIHNRLGIRSVFLAEHVNERWYGRVRQRLPQQPSWTRPLPCRSSRMRLGPHRCGLHR
jgi:CheY-like chemotaxis protein